MDNINFKPYDDVLGQDIYADSFSELPNNPPAAVIAGPENCTFSYYMLQNQSKITYTPCGLQFEIEFDGHNSSDPDLGDEIKDFNWSYEIINKDNKNLYNIGYSPDIEYSNKYKSIFIIEPKKTTFSELENPSYELDLQVSLVVKDSYGTESKKVTKNFKVNTGKSVKSKKECPLIWYNCE